MRAQDPGGRIEVAILDPVHAAGIERLRQTRTVADMSKEAGGGNALVHAEAIVVRTFQVTAPIMDRAPRLRLIVKHGAGVDNIDIPAATERGIAVANTPGMASSTAVAEGAVALMLAVLRQVPAMDKLVRDGRYDERWNCALGDLSNQRLGLVGFGRIARNVARICGSGFAMQVAAYDPFVSPEVMAECGVLHFDDPAMVAARSDVLSVHVPLGEQTRSLVGPEVLSSLPRHAIVINTSRGGTVNERALADALRSGALAGAGLDVFEVEPPDVSNPLFTLPNVVVSPHMAGVTEASMRGMSLDVAEVIEQVFAGAKPSTLLNEIAWPAERRSAPPASEGEIQ